MERGAFLGAPKRAFLFSRGEYVGFHRMSRKI
jgi:hypothetical protein